MSHVYFTGKAKWAKLISPDEKYGKYSISVGLDTKQYMELQKLKVKNAGKLDDEGVFWVNFHRKGDLKAPKVIDESGNPVTTPLGNGSEVAVKVEVKSWTNREGTIQNACVLDTVQVSNLVIYDPNKKAEVAASPAGQSAAAHVTVPITQPPSSLPTPKRLF